MFFFGKDGLKTCFDDMIIFFVSCAAYSNTLYIFKYFPIGILYTYIFGRSELKKGLSIYSKTKTKLEIL